MTVRAEEFFRTWAGSAKGCIDWNAKCLDGSDSLIELLLADLKNAAAENSISVSEIEGAVGKLREAVAKGYANKTIRCAS